MSVPDSTIVSPELKDAEPGDSLKSDIAEGVLVQKQVFKSSGIDEVQVVQQPIETPSYSKPKVISQSITLSVLPNIHFARNYGPPPVIRISSNKAEILDELLHPDLWGILIGLGFEVDEPANSLPPTPPPSPAPFANLLPIAVADDLDALDFPPLPIFVRQDILVTID
ncbi:hypothetical protein NP233_g86 [Leucocoprinus birnbaumii]|uniref:Uncharacterized protein n=1 Tax=Leucocoprinus birnbaumii TaxID=56174 RepID=A0AAD5YW37_9AGAR|nr:hypothetical protein NP233_g86 [Leucocoprinus birnbaumii]